MVRPSLICERFAEDGESLVNDAIEPDRESTEIRHDPFSLPAGFYWANVNVNDDAELKELYVLLNENYVEDDDHMFRFDYSPEFLRWAVQPPGWLQQWHCGVRSQSTDKLLAFIAAMPCTIRIVDK